MCRLLHKQTFILANLAEFQFSTAILKRTVANLSEVLKTGNILTRSE